MSITLTIDLLLKITLLLGAVLLLDSVWKNASAAVRHRLWTWGCLFALMLPAASVFLPQYQLPILPNRTAELADSDAAGVKPEFADTNSIESLPLDSMDPFGAQMERVASRSINPIEEVVKTRDQQQVPAFTNNNTNSSESQESIAAVQAFEPNQKQPETGPASLATWLLLVWSMGSLLTFLPWLSGQWIIRKIWHSSEPIIDLVTQRTLARLCREMGVRSTIQLRESAIAPAPLTWGMFSPVILLPADWQQWSPGALQAVLLHELAHIQRRDLVCQLLARVTCSMYWFHPLVWYAARRLRIERELACNDCVVSVGQNADVYATHLVAIARGSFGRVPCPVLPMVQASGLKHRVRAIFDTSRSHSSLSLKTSTILFLTALLLVVPLLTVRAGLVPKPETNDSAFVFDRPESLPVVEHTDHDIDSRYNVQNRVSYDDHWTVKVQRASSTIRTEVSLLVTAYDPNTLEESLLKLPIYEVEVHPSIWEKQENRLMLFPFFEYGASWSSIIGTTEEQNAILTEIKEQYQASLRELVKPYLSFVDGKPVALPPEQLAELVDQVTSLDLVTETKAFDCLTPVQQQELFGKHVEAMGWEPVGGVLGLLALGLSADQFQEFERAV